MKIKLQGNNVNTNFSPNDEIHDFENLTKYF